MSDSPPNILQPEVRKKITVLIDNGWPMSGLPLTTDEIRAIFGALDEKDEYKKMIQNLILARRERFDPTRDENGDDALNRKALFLIGEQPVKEETNATTDAGSNGIP